MVISVFLIKLGRPAWVTIIPLTFLMVMALIALAIQLGDFWEQQNYLLVVLDIVVLGASILVTLEAWRALREAKSEAAGGV
jgi:carbon starvation protein